MNQRVPTVKVNSDGTVEGTGKTLEELAKEAAPEDNGFMQGSSGQLSLDVGGRDDLIGSRIKIASGDFPLAGQFPQGKRVRIEMEIEIDEIHFKTVRDRDGLHMGRDRIHRAVITEPPKIVKAK